MPPDTAPERRGLRGWSPSGFVSRCLAHSGDIGPFNQHTFSHCNSPFLKRNFHFKIPIPIPIPIHSRGLAYISSCNFDLRLSLKFYRYDARVTAHGLAGKRTGKRRAVILVFCRTKLAAQSWPSMPSPSWGEAGQEDDAWPGFCYDSRDTYRADKLQQGAAVCCGGQ